MKFRILLYLLLYVFVVSSCEHDVDSLALGKEILKPTTRLAVLDTFSIEMSTGILDSIITSGTYILLAGTCNEASAGRIISKSYFQVGLPRSYSIKDNEVFDSLTLSLSYNGYILGDTTVPQRLTVHRLANDYNPEQQADFYNTDSIDYEDSPVGSIYYLPRPESDDKLEITLDELLGAEIFTFLKGNDSDLASDDDFLEILKGLVLVPDISAGSCIAGFTGTDTSLFLKVYTHITEQEETSNEIKLPMINTDEQFNQMSCDWSNNPVFKDHLQTNIIPSSITGGKTYIMAGLGLFTRIRVPSLPRILEFENCALISAQLYFEPVRGSYKVLPDASKLRIYETNKHNVPESVLLDASYNELTPSLNLDEYYNENTYYVFDITYYLSIGLSDHYLDPEQALSVSFSSSYISLSADGIVLECNKKNLSKPRLELLMLFYDQR